MKFAKEIESASYDLPSDWRPYLIHYKLLKKAIRLVVAELRSRGLLDIEKGGGELNFSYGFDGDVKDPQPCINITVDDAAARLIPDLIPTRSASVLKIKLVKDSEFFHMLLEGLSQAALLHSTEQKRLSGKVDALEMQLAKAASPKKQKDIKAQLQWFTKELDRQNLVSKLGSKDAREALNRFVQMNVELADFKRFHALNHTAMTKILKKHDKQSGLTARTEFPTFAKDNVTIVENVLLALYSTITSKLISIVPQVDDHSCPICFSITWRPIRLDCGHVFCVRCLIKAHRKKLLDCPVCRRKHAVANADAANLDRGLQNFLMMYFPREIKNKRKESEKEQAMMDMEALTGRAWTLYTNGREPQCSIM
ncbi:SPX domain-containing protein [Zychaea mexicana]|uniref:SPX domain-containing protein n=1 Tax=Zychaea mexicana TaxID=64656 RepID=UPI0022FE6707|nr:SPX domain-containing protein [Zychaea mexicana]KAI9493199.1 SPX domain-containing protein [Zychaea mexicana]